MNKDGVKFGIKSSGFTLVELVTVIGILAIMSLFIFRQFGLAQDDAKFGIAQNVLLKNFPEAISAALQRYGTCATLTRERLVARGLNPDTPWGGTWLVEGSEPSVKVTYDMDTNLNATDMQELLQQLGMAVFGELKDSEETADLVIPDGAISAEESNIIVNYNCSATFGE